MHLNTAKKRKHRQYPLESSSKFSTSAPNEDRTGHRSIIVQAYEADIIRGPHAILAAQSLQTPVTHTIGGEKPLGDALLRWGGVQSEYPNTGFSGDEETLSPHIPTRNSDEIWVDRYDVRLLLDTLPPPTLTRTTTTPPGSPCGWSDLPSDSEDTFFLSQGEIDDIHREKRRRMMEEWREERLRARMAEDGDEIQHEEEQELWNGPDEEPEESIKELMKRTAAHIISSPNPAQLEMRILANHGNDKRFAFLRGRWARAWAVIKGRERMNSRTQKNTTAPEKPEKVAGGGRSLGGLVGYDDSDDDEKSEDNDNEIGEDKESESVKDSGNLVVVENQSSNSNGDSLSTQDSVKEARRQKAKEWAEKRRAMKETTL